MEIPVIVSIGVGFLTVVAIIVLYFLKRSQNKEDESEPPVAAGTNKSTDIQTKFSRSKSGSKTKGKYQPQKKKNYLLEPHPYLAANFKGHTDTVLSLSFEPGGKYLASISKDRTLRLWIMKTINDKEKRFGVCNFGHYDHASCVAFSPDGKAVLASVKINDLLKVLKITKNGGTVSVGELFHEVHLESKNSEHVSLSIAPNGSFIMMCNETSFSLFKIKGVEEFLKVTTNLSPNTCAVVSPCSKFVACAGFTTSVKIYEVEFSKDGEFQKVSSVMSLNGHSASVVSLQFSADSKRIVTVSKDKTCRLWDIDVRYRLQEETHCLRVISLDSTHAPSQVTLSPDGLVVAVALHISIWFYSSTTGTLLDRLDNVHNEPITKLIWEPNSLYLVSAGGDDRYIRVWHNVPGMREQLKNNEQDLRTAKSEALKERLKNDIANVRERLQKLTINL